LRQEAHGFIRGWLTAGDLRRELGVWVVGEGDDEDNPSSVLSDTSIRGIVLCVDGTFGGLLVYAVPSDTEQGIILLVNQAVFDSSPEFSSWKDTCENWNQGKILFESVRAYDDERD
jgi:hypothetical protein